ncbi:MAG: M56 family metallopeptidase, partial [Flavobacterium sp.]|nr:M56 family metallopeptidase [Flavobacterium sp.]
MEAFGIYILKVTALITVFFLAYHFFLRKETFFNANRGYLIAGLFTSALLPLISYTKIIWVERTPIASITYADGTSQIQMAVPVPADTGFQIDYHYLFSILYSIGIILFCIRFLSEYRSLRKILEKPKAVTHNKFYFIDTEKVQSPFSFFNYIVYNSKLLQQDELSDIIEYEKIYSRQKHSLDMMIAQVFCIFFWFNPIMWIYKKAIAQNLEFIADAEATKVVDDIKAYQKTLVKVTMQTQCIAITNHFYQSLIKKRIVMLNTNQ